MSHWLRHFGDYLVPRIRFSERDWIYEDITKDFIIIYYSDIYKWFLNTQRSY